MRAFLPLLLSVLASCGGGPVIDPDAGPDACASCTPDPCQALSCPDPRHTCVSTVGAAECRCPAGTHAVSDRCEDDTTCTPTTCGPGGLCTDSGGTLLCECAEGYEGDRCERCAAGFFRDANGACDSDLCDPSPCTDPDRSRCTMEGEAVACLCNAGTHDEAGVCVPDTVCTADTCSARGTCSADGTDLSCACDEGYAGRFCEECADTHHPDGSGGCTTDVCLPDPCTSPPFTRCAAGPSGASCECPAGMHREGMACAIDEVCTADSCTGHGTCEAIDGRVQCTCVAGYAGARCEGCDAGYHDDGAGACTTDPCLPNPCGEPNRGVCVASSSGASCECDAGYHDDGVGVCTTDPCLPHPCGTQACRAGAGGAAECYTPVCDDRNPCTMDTPGPTGCTFAPLANGTDCSSTACRSGQTCMAGTCTGGAPVDCADTNPCTVDTCDAVVGCQHAPSSTIVPDDGLACTIDTCTTGVEQHTPSDAACSDGRWCTGTERCAPTDGARDARGCVRGAPPAPPGPSTPCAGYGACDDASQSFPPFTRAGGSTCDDGIACTTGDACVTTGGACAGTVTSSCTLGTSCASTTPWTSSIDVPTAVVNGTLTVDGLAPPPMVPPAGYGTSTLWAVAQDTGARHRLGQLRYTSSVTGGYRLATGDGTFSVRLVPGVYDLLYDRDVNTSTTGMNDRWVYDVTSASPVPNGWRLLREDVVIGPGTNGLTVDIASSNVSGSITVDGTAPPSMVPPAGYGTSTIWAVSRDTGARHRLGQLRYTSSVTGGYRLATGDGTYSVRLVPGAYDILYDRDVNTSTTGMNDRWVYDVTSASPVPNGWRMLQTNVLIASGSSTVNVDIASSSVSGSITVDGTAPPSMVPPAGYGTSTIWAVSRDTGARHRLGQLRYTSSVTGGYRLATGDGTYSVRLVPGAYDILYDRDVNTSTTGMNDRWVYDVTSASPVPNGWRLLQENVTVAAGDATVDVDIASSNVSGSITVDGTAPPSMVPPAGYGTSTIWAVSRDTGARHRLGQLRYTSSVTGGYRLAAGDGAYSVRLVPGAYDILYDRDVNTSTTGMNDRWVYDVTSVSPVPNGWRMLQTNVLIAAGSSTVDVDIASSNVSGSITVDGVAPPSMVPPAGYGTSTIWAVSRDTGARHRLGQLRYTSSVTGGYRLAAGDGTYSVRLVPGAYDILYDRDVNTSTTGMSDRWVYDVTSASPVPNGWRMLQTNVTIAAGSATVNVDIPSSDVSGSITVDGTAPPSMVPPAGYGTSTIWAVSRDTGARHRLGQLRYTSSVTGGYRLASGDGTFSVRLVPGTYDVLYDRDVNTSTTGMDDRWVYDVTSASPVPNGWRVLRQCVVFP